MAGPTTGQPRRPPPPRTSTSALSSSPATWPTCGPFLTGSGSTATSGARWFGSLRPAIPRHEVITELYAAIAQCVRPLHDGPWARATLEVCLALLQSAREDRDGTLARTSAGRAGR